MATASLIPPTEGDTWVGLSARPLPVEQAASWVVRPETGATVAFNGTARDHAHSASGERRDGVEQLSYEAYESQVVPRLERLVGEARRRWPELVRVAVLHRTGAVALGDSAVVVAVSTGHRGPAFESAAWLIDTLKRTVPIWKHESWEGGSAWGLEPQHLEELGELDPS